MSPATFVRQAVRPALGFLPPEMTSTEAVAMIAAICLQESRLRHRRQINGPARGFAQFEKAGIQGVMRHRSTWLPMAAALTALDYPLQDRSVHHLHEAVEHNDILMACFARCLLWTVPRPLPSSFEPDQGWEQYLWAWRPGKPHPETWEGNFLAGWHAATVEGAVEGDIT